MNGKDLYDALNEIDDEFIVEVTKADAEYAARKAGKSKKPSFFAQFSTNVTAADDAEEIKKPSVMLSVLKIAACIAVVAVLVGGGLMIKSMLGGGKTGRTASDGEEAVTPTVDPNLQEEPNPDNDPNLGPVEAYYEELIYDSEYYTKALTQCEKVGERLGSGELTMYMSIDEDEDGDPFGQEAGTPEKVAAEVYAIPGISPKYAVAVKHPETEQYDIYSRVYLTGSFEDLKNATQLATYITPENEFTVIRNGQNITIRTQITTEKALATLFKNQDIPIFDMRDMPNAFFEGTMHFEREEYEPFDPASSYLGRYTTEVEGYQVTFEDDNTPFESHPSEGSPEAQEFCKGKEIGTMTVVAKVDNSLLGWKGMNVYLYSGGWVITDVYCIYVGPEAATDFLNLFEIPAESTVPET